MSYAGTGSGQSLSRMRTFLNVPNIRPLVENITDL